MGGDIWVAFHIWVSLGCGLPFKSHRKRCFEIGIGTLGTVPQSWIHGMMPFVLVP